MLTKKHETENMMFKYCFLLSVSYFVLNDSQNRNNVSSFDIHYLYFQYELLDFIQRSVYTAWNSYRVCATDVSENNERVYLSPGMFKFNSDY